LGDIDLKDFLKHYIKEKRGKVLLENGEEVGFHDGAVFHTLGERHGFTITKKSPNDGPYYIISKDVKKNTIIVSQKHSSKSTNISLLGNFSARPSRPAQNFSPSVLVIQDTNWISRIPDENKYFTAQIRYHGELLSCKIKITAKTGAEIIFKNSVLAASGQSVVLYDGEICLGGGVIV
jgi:tRNA-specific 2-thiouridylase